MMCSECGGFCYCCDFSIVGEAECLQAAKSELGFREGQPIGIEYHNQGFPGSRKHLISWIRSQSLDMFESRYFAPKKISLRKISLWSSLFLTLFHLHPFSDYAFVSATAIHPANILARRPAYFSC
jgi:hypothetical protein